MRQLLDRRLGFGLADGIVDGRVRLSETPRRQTSSDSDLGRGHQAVAN